METQDSRIEITHNKKYFKMLIDTTTMTDRCMITTKIRNNNQNIAKGGATKYVPSMDHATKTK